MIVVAACFRRELQWVETRGRARLLRTAMGERSGEDAEREFHGESVPTLLLSTGFCGAADAGLATGDLVLAGAVRYRGEEIRVDPELLEHASSILRENGVSARVGTVCSLTAVADSSKKRACDRDGCLSVDMESGPLAAWTRTRGVPFLSLRGVLDPVDLEVPFDAALPVWVNVLRHPRRALDLTRRSSLVGRAVGRAVSTLIGAWKGTT